MQSRMLVSVAAVAGLVSLGACGRGNKNTAIDSANAAGATTHGAGTGGAVLGVGTSTGVAGTPGMNGASAPGGTAAGTGTGSAGVAGTPSAAPKRGVGTTSAPSTHPRPSAVRRP